MGIKVEIELSSALKIKAINIQGLDPISIYLEDFAPGRGKITISCWDKSWHSFWPGMGNRTIAEFFLSCDNGYIAKNLSKLRPELNDYDALCEKIKEECQDENVIDEIEYLGTDNEWYCWISNNSDVMVDLFGYDWHFDIPTKVNPEYKYLCKIIDATKEALLKATEIKKKIEGEG